MLGAFLFTNHSLYLLSPFIQTIFIISPERMFKESVKKGELAATNIRNWIAYLDQLERNLLIIGDKHKKEFERINAMMERIVFGVTSYEASGDTSSDSGIASNEESKAKDEGRQGEGANFDIPRHSPDFLPNQHPSLPGTSTQQLQLQLFQT